jgi:hypothetical protein
VVEEPKSVTVTGSWSSNTTYAAFVTRRGSYAKFKISVETSGAPTSANLSVILPSGYTIDTTKLPGTLASGRTPLGIAYCSDGASVTYPGQVNYLSTTSVALFTQFVKTDDAGSANDPVKEWEINQAVPFTFGAGDSVQMEFEVPIAEWAGSGVVNLAQNDVEYASNSKTDNTAADTTSFAYGPAGNLMPNAAVGTTYVRRVQFQSTIQAGDQLIVEIDQGSGQWLPASQIMPYMEQATNNYGIALAQVSSTAVTVSFRTGGARASGATYGANGGPFSDFYAAGYKWRVRKTAAGAAVGFGIVVPGVSSGLVSASGLPGRTDGQAVASGYIGQVVSASLTNGTLNNSTTVYDVASLVIPAGVWMVYCKAMISPAGTSTTYRDISVTTSSTTLDPVTQVRDSGNGSLNTFIATTPYYINTTGTTLKLLALASFTGTSPVFTAASSSFYAVRIA